MMTPPVVYGEDEYRVCVGNWNLSQITELNRRFLPTDTIKLIHRHLVSRVDTIWAAQQQA